MQGTKNFAISRALLQIGLERSAAQCKLRRYVKLNDNEVDEANVDESLKVSEVGECVLMMKEAVVDEVYG